MGNLPLRPLITIYSVNVGTGVCHVKMGQNTNTSIHEKTGDIILFIEKHWDSVRIKVVFFFYCLRLRCVSLKMNLGV